MKKIGRKKKKKAEKGGRQQRKGQGNQTRARRKAKECLHSRTGQAGCHRHQERLSKKRGKRRQHAGRKGKGGKGEKEDKGKQAKKKGDDIKKWG